MLLGVEARRRELAAFESEPGQLLSRGQQLDLADQTEQQICHIVVRRD